MTDSTRGISSDRRNIGIPSGREYKAEYRFVRAGFLDIPMIHGLMLEGADARVFGASSLRNFGPAKLFILLSVIILRERIMRTLRKRYALSLEVLSVNMNPIGFVLLTTKAREGVALEQEVTLCAVVREYRGYGHGKAMVRMLVERLPGGSILTVSCTKFAKRMQAILRRLQFTRDKQQVQPAPGLLNLHIFRYVRKTEGHS